MNTTYADTLDLNGNERTRSTIDIGAFESLLELINLFKLKENGNWIDILKIYKKINGIWVQ